MSLPDLAPDPPRSAPEKETLQSFLDFQRSVMIRKASDLSGTEVRKEMTPSGLTLLGLIKHLAHVERWWFRMCFAGQEVPHASTEEDPDADFRVEADESTDQIIALYRDEIDHANRIIEAATLDDLSVRPSRGANVSLRWIVVHMIEETARHAGHADVMREQIDGATGD